MKESREIIRKPLSDHTEVERVLESKIMPGTGRYPSYPEPFGQVGMQFIDYWRAIRKRLWLVIGIAVCATTLTALYMARKPSIYAASAKIQVDLEQNNPDLVTSDRQRSASNPDPSYFNTQLQLLTSDALLRRVIKEKSLDSSPELGSARKGGGASIWQSVMRAVGLSPDPAKTNADGSKTLETSDSENISPDEIADAVRLAPYVELIKSSLSIEPVRESRATFKDTRLIDISFRHEDPRFAAALVNSIGETFVKQNWEKRTGTSRKTNDFLQQRISDLQAEIKSDELKLVDLKKTVGIIKTEGEQTVVLDRLSGLNRDLLEAENVRKLAEAKYNSVLKSPENARAMTEDKMARYITEQENNLRTIQTETQKKIADLLAERAKRLEEFREKAPEIQEIDTQVKSLQDSLQSEIARNRKELSDYRQRSTQVLVDGLKTEYLQAKDREDKVRASYNEQYSLAQGQNTGEVQIRLLEQNIETNRGFLEQLRKQQSGNDVAAQGSDNNISIADYAIPDDRPVAPRRTTTVLGALFLSTLFGMGLALFLEYLDDTISSTEDVETYLQLPALAVIPSMLTMPKRKLLLVSGGNEQLDERAKSELLLYADSRSALAEAYRQLRTSILLSTAGHAPKSLLITSSLPSEGKTTTATNTAISLAQTGAKVLIIDADMRKPRVHSVFNIANTDGLSTVLSSNISEQEILNVIKTEPSTNVSIMTSGPIPPNPAELIGSEQMPKLLKMLGKHFDHVVVDSPPISSFTDGVLVASIVDGVILVVHGGKSSRQVVRRAKQLVADVGGKIFGVVLNNVNISSPENIFYYQSYYHQSTYEASDEQ